jgi:hypothetical protein
MRWAVAIPPVKRPVRKRGLSGQEYSKRFENRTRPGQLIRPGNQMNYSSARTTSKRSPRVIYRLGLTLPKGSLERDLEICQPPARLRVR